MGDWHASAAHAQKHATAKVAPCQDAHIPDDQERDEECRQLQAEMFVRSCATDGCSGLTYVEQAVERLAQPLLHVLICR